MVYLNNIIVLIRFNKICLYIYFLLCLICFKSTTDNIIFVTIYNRKKRTLYKMVKFCIIKIFFLFMPSGGWLGLRLTYEGRGKLR